MRVEPRNRNTEEGGGGERGVTNQKKRLVEYRRRMEQTNRCAKERRGRH